jgi:hypothetical protein
MGGSSMKEITGSGPLLDKQGNLADYGWARQPLLDANLENVNIYSLKFLQPLRTKRWQYFGITTPSHYFSFTLSHVGYLGPVFAYVLDFNTGKYHEQTLSIPFGSGIVLARNSTSGDCHYEKGSLYLRFSTPADSQRRLEVNWPGFGGSGIKADLKLYLSEGQESVVNVFPFENRRFFYTRKVNCMPAEGTIEYGLEEGIPGGKKKLKSYSISPDSCLGTLDWGVGVWPYRSFWIWASFSQFLPDGRTIGLNVGDGIGNSPELNDNAIILDGRVHKLGKIDFKYDKKDFKKPWMMTSADGRLSLGFAPFFERVARTDVGVLASEVHQMFGRYSGTLVTDAGEKIAVKDMIGWAEEHHARW